MREAAVFAAIIISLLLSILRRAVYECGGLDLPDFPALRGAYQDRFWSAQWDMPLWLCVFEVVLHALRAKGLVAVRGARLGAAFAALRLGFTRYVCAREGDVRRVAVQRAAVLPGTPAQLYVECAARHVRSATGVLAGQHGGAAGRHA